jgi:hypothetical protein
MPPALKPLQETMPVNWKASVPFKPFITCREEYRNSSNSAARTASRSKYSKSSTESTEKPLNKESHYKIQLVATAANKKKRDEAVGILEMQEKLLQNLASRENAVKGFVDEYGGREAKHSPTADVDLEEWKRKTA